MAITCKDCIHREACKNIAYEYAGENAASAYDEDSCCKPFAEICVNFSDKSEWFHLSDKDSATAYYSVGYGNSAQVVEEPIYGWGIKNGQRCVIDECGDFYEIGGMVFLTKEEAQKEVERRRKIND